MYISLDLVSDHSESITFSRENRAIPFGALVNHLSHEARYSDDPKTIGMGPLEARGDRAVAAESRLSLQPAVESACVVEFLAKRLPRNLATWHCAATLSRTQICAAACRN
jgi:hypothetical protein